MPRVPRLLLPLACLLIAACAPTAEDFVGTWRGVMPIEGGDLPFGLEIELQDGQPVAWLVNGPERARVSEVDIDDGQIRMRMPGYPHRLEATLSGATLEGTITFLRPQGARITAPFLAQKGLDWRFFPPAEADAADFSGRWAITFIDPTNGQETSGIAELTQTGTTVTGTVLRTTGDDRYIAGEARGDSVFLSRFDGGSAYLYVARLTQEGELEGEFRSGVGAYRVLSGRRDDAASLADASTLTRLREDAPPLAFSFPDPSGKELSLDDPRFADKVVIVTIGGTWCPNCHDEAAFLRDFLPGRRERGLEVVQLLFEYHTEFDASAAAAREFIAEFAIDYPVLIAGSYEAGAVQQALPQLDNFVAYPTMLVLDRQRRIVYTHTGFSGPATGRHYEEFVAEFSTLVDGLLAGS
ncbi:MAG: peroxiredoxin family protein [Steroidobacteraceae bacterium]